MFIDQNHKMFCVDLVEIRNKVLIGSLEQDTMELIQKTTQGNIKVLLER